MPFWYVLSKKNDIKLSYFTNQLDPKTKLQNCDSHQMILIPFPGTSYMFAQLFWLIYHSSYFVGMLIGLIN